eukprot:164916_1
MKTQWTLKRITMGINESQQSPSNADITSNEDAPNAYVGFSDMDEDSNHALDFQGDGADVADAADAADPADLADGDDIKQELEEKVDVVVDMDMKVNVNMNVKYDVDVNGDKEDKEMDMKLENNVNGG